MDGVSMLGRTPLKCVERKASVLGTMHLLLIIGFCSFVFTATLSAQPPEQLGNMATNAIRSGKLSAGLSYLQRAVEARNRNTDVGMDSIRRRVLSDAALIHGREQFQRLIRDRPALIEHADKPGFDDLSEWAIRMFGGEYSGITVDWDNSQPTLFGAGHSAEHTVPEKGVRGTVRIATVYPDGEHEGKTLPCERLWSLVVLELNNISQAHTYNRVSEQAYHGELSRSEYVTQMFHSEYKAVQQTQSFYAHYYLPWAISAKLSTEPEWWYVSDKRWWEGPEEALDHYRFSESYPWAEYGRQFDRIRSSPGASPRKPLSQTKK